jgi:phosphoenolpyruvate phosphomutase
MMRDQSEESNEGRKMISNKSALFRELLAGSGVVRLAGAHNGISARLVERSGFDAIWASGLEISTSYGVPDAGILTMSELLETARTMNETVGLPIIADCDTGFGEARNVEHMIRRYEAAGIAGVCIEDKQFPKLNSFAEGQQELASISDFQAKIRAAKEAQKSRDFVLIARVEAFIAGRDVDDALARAYAYADAGADAILIHSKEKSPNQVFGFARSWQGRLPVVVVPTTYFRSQLCDFEAAGIKVVIYANHAMRAAVKAMSETLAAIKISGSTECVEHKIAPVSELFELQEMNRLLERNTLAA